MSRFSIISLFCSLVAVAPILQAADPKVSCGTTHCLALHADGTAWAWGNNKDGQLGDGTTTNQPIPVVVQGLQNVVDVSAGYSHSLAVTADGAVWGWGKNDLGQVGDGSTTNRTQPTKVGGLSGVAAVAAGGSHSLARTNDGRVWTWGNNFDGQAGVGTDGNNYRSPQRISSLWNVIGIAAGENHSLAVQNNGALWAWGLNVASQLGDMNNVSRSIPFDTGLRNVVSVAAGSSHTLAVLGDGTAWGWGHSRFGQVGVGAIGDIIDRPTKITGIADVQLVEAGKFHSLALLSSGKIWAWGQNIYGQLGDGGQANRAQPVPIIVVDTVVMPAAGEKHTAVIKSDGQVWAWGDNVAGQLGAPNSNLSEPARITSLEDVDQAVAGADFSFAIQKDKTLWAWGNNEKGQLGDGTSGLRSIPFQLAAISDVAALAAGNKHAVAVKSDGTLWAWGSNEKGQLGDGTTVDRLAPIQVPGMTGVQAVSAGFGHTVVLKTDGTVWAWGQNDYGQLGDNTIEDRAQPLPVNGLAGVIAIATGDYHSLALLADGTLKAWGQNNFGQLGDATEDSQGDSQLEPVTVDPDNGEPADMIQPGEPEVVNGVTVTGPAQIGAITAGSSHSMALKPDGTVWVWGYSNVGQLGLGDIATRMNPLQNPNLAGIEAITTDWYHSLAIDPAGALWAWGKNEFGQLGDGSNASKTAPAPVVGLTEVEAIATGSGHSLAVKADGTLWAWGANTRGELGNGQIAKVSGLQLLLSGSLSIKNLSFNDGEKKTLEAIDLIATEGEVIINPGADIKFIAPTVTLGPGFHALLGSAFYAGSKNPESPALAARNLAPVIDSAPWPLALAQTRQIPPTQPTKTQPPAAQTIPFHRLPPGLQDLLSGLGAKADTFFADAAARNIVFSSPTPLFSGDQNGTDDVYLFDAKERQLRLVSFSLQGKAGNGPSVQPQIDGLGRQVVYASAADDLSLEADQTGVADIYLYHVFDDINERLSFAMDGGESPFPASHPAISGDGQVVAFQRPDSQGVSQIYETNSAWPAYAIHPVTASPAEPGPWVSHRHPRLSADGRQLTYREWTRNGDQETCRQVVLDRAQKSIAGSPCTERKSP